MMRTSIPAALHRTAARLARRLVWMTAMAVIGAFPASALSGQGRTTSVAVSGPSSTRPGEEPAFVRSRERYDSLRRIVENTPIGDPRRPRLVGELDQAGHDLAVFVAKSVSGPARINVGLVVETDLQLVMARSRDEGARLLQAAMPRGMLGFIVTGVALQEFRLSGMYMRYYEYPVIESVDPGSPADSAGVAAGDTLMAYNGQDVRVREVNLTRLLEPSRTIVIRLRRGPETRDVSVVAAPVNEATKQRRFDLIKDALDRATGVAPVAAGSFALAAVQLQNLNPQLSATLGLTDGAGVLVEFVPRGIAAYDAGLRGGDVIIRVGTASVRSVMELRRLIEATPGPLVALEVFNRGNVRRVELAKR